MSENMEQTKAQPDSVFDAEAMEILNKAIKSVPQEIWDSIALAKETAEPVITSTYSYSAIGTSDAFVH